MILDLERVWPIKNTNKTMNNTRLGTAILSILVLSLSWLHTPAHAEPMGILPKGEGVIYQNELGIQTVRKTFSKDTPMKCHNHPNDIVILTVTNGLAQVIKWSRSTYAVFRWCAYFWWQAWHWRHLFSNDNGGGNLGIQR